jgi:hypothetical protein
MKHKKKLTIGPNDNSRRLGYFVAVVVAYSPCSLPVSTPRAVAHGGGWGVLVVVVVVDVDQQSHLIKHVTIGPVP